MQTQNVAPTKFEEWKNIHEFFTSTESDKQKQFEKPCKPARGDRAELGRE